MHCMPKYTFGIITCCFIQYMIIFPELFSVYVQKVNFLLAQYAERLNGENGQLWFLFFLHSLSEWFSYTVYCLLFCYIIVQNFVSLFFSGKSLWISVSSLCTTRLQDCIISINFRFPFY